jgi:hypothetical protein
MSPAAAGQKRTVRFFPRQEKTDSPFLAGVGKNGPSIFDKGEKSGQSVFGVDTALDKARQKRTVRFSLRGKNGLSIFLLGMLLLAGCATAREAGGGGSAALEAFQRGEFDRAEALSRDSRDDDSLLLRANLLLLRNRAREAANLLSPAATRVAKTIDDVQVITRARELLAQALLRLDDFNGASEWFKRLGETIAARKYEALARSVAYLTEPVGRDITVDLLGANPLPHVSMTVKGRTGIFVIDTSIDEILIDRDFAERAGLTAFGVRTTSYSAAYNESIADHLELGNLTIKNVPVHIGKMNPNARLRAHGAIGLAFLMHFDFTIDYRRSKLVLRPAGGTLSQGLPAVLAGDRHLLAQGSLNGQPGAWIAIHTALQDVVVAASESTVNNPSGPVREIAAGSLRLTNPPLDASAFPPDLDGAYGFRVGFMLGHDALRDRSIRLEPRSMRMLIE